MQTECCVLSTLTISIIQHDHSFIYLLRVDVPLRQEVLPYSITT